MERTDNGRQVWFICLALCLGTFLLYGAVLKHNFINFDDPIYVTENPFIQNGVTASTLSWALTTGHAGNWHPLTWISHALDCQIYGLKHPGGHHLTNLLFHIANTLLLFLVLRRMTGAVWRSAMVAALFAWHPLHVESVAWVAERKDVLSTLFWLLTLWAYARYVTESKVQSSKSKAFYGAALLCFGLGLMSKPMLVTLPFVLLLLDFWPLKRSAECGVRSAELGTSSVVFVSRWRHLVAEKVPFFAISLVLSVVTFLVQRQGGAVMEMNKFPLPIRVGNALMAYAGYLRKMFWPSDLAVFYPIPNSLPASHWLAAGALLAAVSVVAVALARTRPYFLFGWLWFLGTLVPVIGLVQVGSQSMADRYTYMPLVGIAIIFAWGVADLFCGRRLGRWNLSWAIFAPVLAACVLMTWEQLPYWQNSETLFRHALAMTTNNVVAHIDLGRALDDAGRPDEAKAEFAAALRIEPESPATLNGLGVHFAKQGDMTNALGYYASALRNQPFYGDAHYNLGNVLAHEGKLAEAADQYAEALRIKPDSPDAHNNLGAVLAGLGQLDEAVAHFKSALRLRPNYPEAQDQLGGVMVKMGRLDLARIHYGEAVRLKPDFVHAQLKLGLVMAQQGDVQPAIPHFQAALAIEPANADGYFYLGASYGALGNWGLAAQAFDEAVRLKPGDAEAGRRLAEAKAKAGKPH
ncbi:MAG: Tetratricopeptide 2 repeat protein [Pedosphaera sp.]|nr:Tetratricopeptide 2 repeat protein [Pedosphaera sp.]